MDTAQQIDSREDLKYGMMVAAVALSLGVGLYLTPSFDQLFDWWGVFHPAGRQLFDVYHENRYFVNAPWLTLILLPFSLLPVRIGYLFFCVFQTLIVGWSIRKEGGVLEPSSLSSHRRRSSPSSTTAK